MMLQLDQNPTVLYQERFIQDPKMFEITPNSLLLALGLLDMNFNYYIDETIFSVQGVHITKQNVWNNLTNQCDQILSSKVFNLVNCTEKHIPDPQLRTFFLQSNLNMNQCIPLDFTLQILVQFNSEVYQELNFYFKKCTSLKCKNDSDINQLLSSNNVELVFTDVFFSPQSKDNPFTNFLETCTGLQITDPSNDYFFHLVIRFKKSNENLYKRNYDNLFIILSQILDSIKAKFYRVSKLNLNQLGEMSQDSKVKQIQENSQNIDLSLGRSSKQQSVNLFAFDQIIENYENQEQIENKKHKLQFNTFAYMISPIIKCFKCYKTKQQLIDFGFQELNNTLDIKNILQKLAEIDKLKRVVLNNEQMILFDYIHKQISNTNCKVIKNYAYRKYAHFHSNQVWRRQNKIDVSLLSLIQKFQFEDSPSKQMTKQLINPALFAQKKFYNENVNIQQNNMLQDGGKNYLDGSDDKFIKNYLKNYEFKKYVRYTIKNEDQNNKD
ncbi:hypothetical protein ABPG72_009677 [Tetrahymena utriculariae]